jgi:uncharacterized membrane protein
VEEERKPLDSPATHENILRLARNGTLNVGALERALQITGDSPDRKRWARFLDTLLLVLGAGSLISGIFFFFAFNWASMHRFIKLGILEAAILVTVGLAFWRGLERLSGKIALGGAGLLVGALLAVYGQIYQTGADSYQLFLYWAILIAGWVWISKFTPLWSIWVVLLNVSFILYWVQIVSEFSYTLFLVVFVLNGIALIAWELARNYKVDWLRSHWPPRLFVLPVFAALVVPTLIVIQGYDDIFERFQDPMRSVMVILYIGMCVLVAYAYSQIRLDLFMLIVCAFSLMITLNTFVWRFLDFGIGTLLFFSGLFITQAAVVVILLRRVSIAWETREQ